MGKYLVAVREKITIKKIIKLYLFCYFVIMSMYCGIYGSTIIGEWDDYSLPAVSIMTEHNFSITADDIKAYKEIFPDWATEIDDYGLSGLFTRNGGEMAWYFPTYSIVCIPMIILLELLELPTTYAFVFTNLALLMLLLFIVYRYLAVKDTTKLFLILLLSLNPIIFYYFWPSAETFLFTFIGLTMLCWYNGWYKRAAVCVSIAGSLNPTIMSIGIIMIAEFLYKRWVSRDKEDGFIEWVKKDWTSIILYGCCYIIGLVPLAYNYYNVGHINLTAANSSFTSGTESTIARFWSYLLDLNYGLFPYFSIIMIVAAVMLIVAVIWKKWFYLEYIIAFLINVFLYSIMVHINCGMSGIARYNVWAAVILIFAVVVLGDDNRITTKPNVVIKGLLLLQVLVLSSIIYIYGPFTADKTEPLSFTPIAQRVLYEKPSLYNPLYSTFNSRTNKLDGGYTIETPVVYSAEDGYVRKILANKDDADYILENYFVLGEDKEFLKRQVSKLTEKNSYINCPKDYKVAKGVLYELGEKLYFSSKENSMNDYIVMGMSNPEEWGTWTDSDKVCFRFKINSGNRSAHGILTATAFNGGQNVQIYANNKLVFNDIVTDGKIEFEIPDIGQDGIIEIFIYLPDAISPKSLGLSPDTRQLGLGLYDFEIIE